MKPILIPVLLLLALLPSPCRAEDPPGFLLKWGSPGTGPGQFLSPEGMAVDPAGNVFVSDSGNNRVQKFTGDGVYLGEVDGLASPLALVVDQLGTVYVAEFSSSRIKVFDNNLNYLREWPASGGGGLGIDPTGQYLYTAYLGDLVTFRISDGAFLSRSHFAPNNKAPLRFP